ncbi:MATE family efflux transporter [Marinicrinis sediminis]|uniref:Probable multidrug resistance protein NorM n=1 Tax=Marinicrinis sediminis TaxID=1652465 RepID=A0ABW5R9H1_9BACL
MRLGLFRRWGAILSLAIPSIFAFASMTATGAINLVMIGGLGATAIAIVGVVNILMYNAFAIFSGIGHSVNYLVAQNYGAGEMDKGIQRASMALKVTLLVAILIAILGMTSSELLLTLIGGEESKGIRVGTEYLSLRFLAMGFAILSFVFHGIFRGLGDTKTPMVLSIATNAIVLFLTYALTYGHFGFAEMGLRGAGWAYVVGEWVGLVGALFMYFVYYHRKYETRRSRSWNRGEGKLLLTESGKLGIQEFSLSISMLIFTIFISRLGENALAANEIALSVMSFGFMPAFGFGATATILVGQNVGKRNAREARLSGTHTALLCCLFLLVLGIIEYGFASSIANWYTGEKEVYELAGKLIMMSAFLQLFDGLLNTYAGGLRGIGDTTFLTLTSFLLGFLVFVPLTYLSIFVLDWGSTGAWLSLYTYLVLFGILVTVRFYRTRWEDIRMKVAS